MPSECRTDYCGTKRWILNGELYREDGPAVEYKDGVKRWFLNGLRHREDGPAIELADGSKFWYQNGQPHSVDGPAAEYASGYKEWWLNGEQYTFKQWLEYVWDSLSIEEQERYIFNGFEYAE